MDLTVCLAVYMVYHYDTKKTELVFKKIANQRWWLFIKVPFEIFHLQLIVSVFSPHDFMDAFT